MKKNYSWALFAAVLMFLGTLQAFAVDYTISFTGSGKSSTVGSVEVQNLTRGTTATVPNGEVLVLNVTATALSPLNAISGDMRISSTSVPGNSSVSFFANQAGNAQINVYSMDGRKIAAVTQNLQKGANSFQVSLRAGAYVISVQGKGYSYSGKLVSIASIKSQPEISFLGVQEKNAASPLKSADASVTMSYVEGDIMLYKGISGNWATIVTDVPTESKAIDFNFVECKDASGNYYATVKIGDQTWMAENLKTDKYVGGAAIANLTVATDWGNTALVTGAWVYLNNDVANEAKFGKIYNWFAVNDVRGIAPDGWHVPTIDEYETLATTLGGLEIAGGLMKETGTAHWISSDPPATNASGFSARGGGKCNSGGVMNDFDYCYLWTATAINETNGTCSFMTGTGDALTNTYSPGKRNGFSLRCVLNP